MARLVLGSRSPRRAQLLRDAGYDFKQLAPPFDDTGHRAPAALPGDQAIALAAQKARSLRIVAPPEAVLLCADTLCVATDGYTLGKPATRDEARDMIRSFRNADHAVVTGVAIIDLTGRLFTFADTATVRFGDLRDDRLAAYLDSARWRDKAGGYNLFDRQADGWPITVNGDPTTVVGLPMDRLNPVLTGLLPAPLAAAGPAL